MKSVAYWATLLLFVLLIILAAVSFYVGIVDGVNVDEDVQEGESYVR